MERRDIIAALVLMLNEIQEEAGQEVEDISESTRPIGGVSMFDSLTGVIVTLRCIEKFDLVDDGKTISLFQDKKDGHAYALSVGEIADRIEKMIPKE